jgi:hypothetical protein
LFVFFSANYTRDSSGSRHVPREPGRPGRERVTSPSRSGTRIPFRSLASTW